ncbi:MAG: DNA mismatch repair endonuclease MutL [Thermoanaerobaculia bacterium]|nr:DNA mismatch repair endonuclease MutL [Thermoanaerobaculia bacterium]
MSEIRLLPDPLISQIAAGEVVERPASVVKELVENALDAGATEVRIELEAGGRRRIVVADDGSGMDRDDSLLAFDRHATSKITTFDDLERVATLGFRGEALASIAAVAQVELTTARAPGEGHRVRIEGGRVRVAEPMARSRGTTLTVENLFWNVPARRKFLKAGATELRRCLEVVEGYALARPDLRFTVRHEGRALLDTVPRAAGAPGVRERVEEIFGAELGRALVEIPPFDELLPEIWGLVGQPSTARGKRSFVFVNRRLLRDRAILATFYRAVRETWRSEDFPALFLFLDVPPEDVDVNVHPQKSEVRFRNPGLLDRVAVALRRGLDLARGEEPSPLGVPRYLPPPGSLPGEGLGGWAPARHWEVAEPAPAVYDPGDGIGRIELPPASTERLATPAWAPLPERAPIPLSGRSGEARPFRLLGQYKGTLLILEGPDGLYLIDQHVAHERILYERLRRSLRGTASASQRLLSPLLLDLSGAERLRLLELAGDLEGVGFTVVELSGGSVGVSAVPAVLPIPEAEALLLALAGGRGEGTGEAADLGRQVLDALAASMSCKAAIKMHHPLAPTEMEALVAELFAAENPYACPHGRPIVLRMDDADLERRFGRR